jgi:hypothetical protein
MIKDRITKRDWLIGLLYPVVLTTVIIASLWIQEITALALQLYKSFLQFFQ